METEEKKLQQYHAENVDSCTVLTKKLLIGALEVTVSEVRWDAWIVMVEQLNRLLGNAQNLSSYTKVFEVTGGFFRANLGKVVSLSFEDFLKLSPSQTRKIYEAAKEVNADFLLLSGGLIKFFGLEKVLKELGEQVKMDLRQLFAASYQQATSTPGNTDTASEN